MADDGILKIKLGAELDEDTLRRIRESLEKVFSEPFEIVPETRKGSGAEGSYADNRQTSRESQEGADSLKNAIKNYLKDEDNQKKLISKGINQAEKAISSSLTKGFAIVEDIFGRVKAASPLLQAIESLFNLAMTLFFMPLGNKLGEILIPATVELLDNVVKLWDAFEGKTLGEMFAIAIDRGVKLFGEYFNNIGGILKEQGGMVGKIGELLITIGDFIQGPGLGVLNMILTVTTVVMSHLKEFISLWIAMKAAEMTMNAVGFLGEAVGAKTAIGVTALAALAAGATSYGVMTGMGMAEGGYVPAKAGGTLRVLGEGGKGEYVIPEDRVGSVGGNVTMNFYGYNEDQLIQKINDTVNQQISQSRLRSGF